MILIVGRGLIRTSPQRSARSLYLRSRTRTRHSHAHDEVQDHSHNHPETPDRQHHEHRHTQGHSHAHDLRSQSSALSHSHGGSVHSHLPPGSDGERVTWRSLLALGVSGSSSALVVLLASISLGRVGYGLILVVAFSVGLAATLTSVGLAFVYAGRFLSPATSQNRLVRLLPVVSAFVIACVGAAFCYEALGQSVSISPHCSVSLENSALAASKPSRRSPR